MSFAVELNDTVFNWAKIEETIKKDYKVDSIKLLSITFFDSPFEYGKNIGEIEIEYEISHGFHAGQLNHAIWGLYKDGSISCFMD